ncbi:MAG: hypothetical protein ACRDI0_05875 [Actinomycetota bacterium]
MKRMFIVGPQGPDGGSEAWSEAAPRKKSLDRLKAAAAELGGPYRISIRGKTKGLSHGRTMDESLKRLRQLIDRSEVGDTFRVHTQDGTGPAILLRVVEVIEKAELPTAAASWPEAIQQIYQFVFAPGRFPGVQNWGVSNCRLTRQGGSWSYHAWNQAIDVAPVDKKQGDRIERDVQAKFAADLMTIVWQAPLHFDHLHVQTKPDRSGQKPPCAP